MREKLKILHLEDILTDAELVERELKRSGMAFEKLLVDNRSDYISALSEFAPDIILSDHSLPSFNSRDALKILKESGLNIPFILITATISEEFAVEIMKEGAADYILKDRMQRLPNAILNILEKFKLEAERKKFLEEVIANEAMLRQAENIADIGSLDININTKIAKWSPGLYNILGYNVNDIEPSLENFINCIHPEDRLLIEHQIKHAINYLDAISLDFSINCADSPVKYVHAKLLIDKDKNGQSERIRGFVQDVSERKISEMKLDSANQELSLLFQTINEVYFSRDAVNNKLIHISPACRDIFGYSPEEFMEDPELESKLIHPEDKNIRQANYQQLIKGKTVFPQYRIIHKDQSVRWLESKIIPNLDKNGQLLRIYGVSRDITERKNNEEQLQKNHSQLREASETQAAILNALPPNITLLNEKGRIMAVNESWKKFAILNNLGIPNFGIGFNYFAISEKATGANKSDSNKIEHGIKEVIQGSKKDFTMEYVSYLPGETKWFQLIVAPLADKAQQGAVVLHIDITRRKVAENALLQSESNLRSIFENTDLAIVFFDSALNVISFNSNSSDLFTRKFNKKLKAGNSAFKYFPKMRKSFINQIIERVNSDESVNYETTYDPEGAENAEWYDVRWVGVVNQAQENVGIILTLKNITEKRNADIEREKITADLVRRNNDLEQFTYIISHNLRAPVANIIGLSDLLTSFNISNKEYMDILGSLSSSVKNLDEVILDLNHILQINSQINEKIDLINFRDIIEDIKTSINFLIKKENVNIILNLNVSSILTLKNYLHSIFYNLIINSIKYRRADVPPAIYIGTFLQDDKIIVEYSDNGKGIDLEKNGKHLFGLYKRFDYTVEGKGMGLFMVKIQIENLGGKISVESKLDKGTEFRLEFPVTRINPNHK
jgi:PAS domain S-box-containing protein